MRAVQSWSALVALAVCGHTLAAGAAHADVDPASDVLLLQSAFLPYSPKVCGDVADTLRDSLKESERAGYPLKVALIGSSKDLGGAPQLFNKPRSYAAFLGGELGVFGNRNLKTKLRLLVVMPAGVALARSPTPKELRNPPPPLPGAGSFAPEVTPITSVPPLGGVSIPEGADNNDLARVAIAAVPKLAKAAGRSVKPASAASLKCSGGGGGISPALIFGIPVVVLAIGAAVLAIVQRRRASPDDGG